MIDPEAQSPKSDQQIQNEALLGQSEMGTLLLEGYHTALQLDPRLAEMKIVPIEGETHRVAFASPKWAKKNESGKHEVHIRLDNLDKTFEHIGSLMESIPSAYTIMSERSGLRPEQATPRVMYVHALFHEMGHVSRQYFDNESDPAAYQRKLKKDKVALPIGNATTSAIVTLGTPTRDFVDANWDQVQEQLGVETLDDLVHLQAVAYRNMPSEAEADSFAGDVFRANPALMDELLSPGVTAQHVRLPSLITSGK
jgi:hypothetical protein